MHLSMSSRGGGGRSGNLIDRFGPGVGQLNYLAVPGVGIFEFLFEPVTTNHFLGWGISLSLTSHFCPGVGNLTAIFGKMSKSRPMPRLPPAGLTLIGALWCCTYSIARDTNVVVDSIVYITACVAPFILHLSALKLENNSVVLPNLSYRK